MPDLSDRVKNIQPSPTLALDAQAKAMKAKGLDVVNLSIGEPDFPTPEPIKNAAIEAIRSNFTRYTASEGILELREAVCAKFLRDSGLTYTPDQIVISCGGKHALYNALQTLCQEGDEVLIPIPYWVTYPAQAALAGASPVLVAPDPRTQLLTAGLLEQAVTPRSKVLIINSPANPSGMVYSREELQALGEVVKKHSLWVISDDIYESLLYDGRSFVNIPMACPELKDRTIIVHGTSKTYSMTGWRIGYLAAPREAAQAAANFQSQVTSNPCSISQKAALAALNGPQDWAAGMRDIFAERRRLVLDLISRIPSWECQAPAGAFYVFPRITALYGRTLGGEKIRSSSDLARILLKEIRVAAVPGECFGFPGYLRLSYAASLAELEKGLTLIRDFLA